MRAGDVAERIGAGHHSQAEGQRHAEESDTQRIAVTAELGGQHRAAAATQNQPERAEELGGQAFTHAHVLHSFDVLRQRDELLVVAGDGAEVAGFPVVLGLLDALLRTGHEVPPQVARAIQRFAAEQHRLHRGLRAQAADGACLGNDQVLGGHVHAIQLRVALEDVQRALAVAIVDIDLRIRVEARPAMTRSQAPLRRCSGRVAAAWW
ncbi:hypothetical protein G6F57_017948 [Rhizopus arrhizus]|nr:hypothetical protein G6F57_017948 [Rhizopus arrhizus]